ncbi:MAG: hypothetical protein U1F67_15895 [Rubrivivax sp.]
MVPFDEAARGCARPDPEEEELGADDRQAEPPQPRALLRSFFSIDRFRSFVASDAFSAMFDMPAEELREALTDDMALLRFGWRFLAQVLFGEMTIPLRSEAVEERRERVAAQRQRIEREAAERLARDGDEGGTPDGTSTQRR